MEETPLKRWATTGEIADWAYFLTVINRFCTGQNILVDGGELHRLIELTDRISTQLTGFQANVCINYGGRDEILRAARKFAAECAVGEKRPEELDDALFSTYMDSAGIPDPELIIRPSGELRLSNFLLWQCAYAEFYFTDALWPDFDEAELNKAIEAYHARDRRFGGVKK